MKESSGPERVVVKVPFDYADYQRLQSLLQQQSIEVSDFVFEAIVEKMAREGVYPKPAKQAVLIRIVKMTFRFLKWGGRRIRQLFHR